jgi:hypothetical protein
MGSLCTQPDYSFAEGHHRREKIMSMTEGDKTGGGEDARFNASFYPTQRKISCLERKLVKKLFSPQGQCTISAPQVVTRAN